MEQCITPSLKKQKPMPRGYGIFMPVFSLNSPYGIGTLGAPARDFIDFVARAGGSLWQVLPLGPTGYGDSPYQCFSAFAGNPYLIDPEDLFQRGWLTGNELKEFTLPNNGTVDYALLFATRKQALRHAFAGFLKKASAKEKGALAQFRKKAADWLEDYAAFSALKEHFGHCDRLGFGPFYQKTEDAMAFAETALADKKEFAVFLEFVFWRQWQELRAYAAKRGVQLVGDIPLYVSNDSADVWAHPDLFLLDDTGRPTEVAGVPPDSFSADGQLWGNPLYNWTQHKKTDFAWWKRRIAWQAELFDLLRIDHFIGICRYYSIPAGETTAKNGKWLAGPDRALVSTMQAAAGNTRFIAEDLGLVTKEVTRLMQRAGFPGMRLMQFAFSGEDNPNLIHNIPQNAVVYPGTHDNQTLRGFFEGCSPKIRKSARRYLDVRQNKALPHGVIRECFRSPANTAIIPYADLLGLDDTARINTPATTKNNWCWRTEKSPENLLADELAAFAATYYRAQNNAKGGTV